MSAPNVNAGRTRSVMALDATESSRGRAPFMISASYWHADWLPLVDLRFLDLTTNEAMLEGRLLPLRNSCGPTRCVLP
jgi:hypothetical protein